MAGSRLHKIGDIFTRTTGLMRSGAVKTKDKPIWYDIYEAFPPIDVPTYSRQKPEVVIRQIFYPEDSIRAKYFLKYGSPGTMSLNDTKRSKRLNLVESFVNAYQTLQEQQPQLTEDELMMHAERDLESRGIYLDRSRRIQDKAQLSSELVDDAEESKVLIRTANLPEDVLRKINVADIFKEETTEVPLAETAAPTPPALTSATEVAGITVAASVADVDVASTVTDAATGVSDAAAAVSDAAAAGVPSDIDNASEVPDEKKSTSNSETKDSPGK